MADKEIVHTVQITNRQKELVNRALNLFEASLKRQANSQRGINPAISEILTTETGEVSIVRMKF